MCSYFFLLGLPSRGEGGQGALPTAAGSSPTSSHGERETEGRTNRNFIAIWGERATRLLCSAVMDRRSIKTSRLGVAIPASHSSRFGCLLCRLTSRDAESGCARPVPFPFLLQMHGYVSRRFLSLLIPFFPPSLYLSLAISLISIRLYRAWLISRSIKISFGHTIGIS